MFQNFAFLLLILAAHSNHLRHFEDVSITWAPFQDAKLTGGAWTAMLKPLQEAILSTHSV